MKRNYTTRQWVLCFAVAAASGSCANESTVVDGQGVRQGTGDDPPAAGDAGPLATQLDASPLNPVVTKDGAADPAPDGPAGLLDAAPLDLPDASIEDASPDTPAETDPAKQAAVPDTWAGEYDCEGVYEAPDLCEWIAVGDVTAVGTIEALDLPNDLVWGWAPDAPDGRWLEDGEWRAANPALTIDLRIDHLLYGDAPERVSVRVGWHQVDVFAPSPSSRGKDPETGELLWTDVSSQTGWEHRGPLRVGQRIVLGFSEVMVERDGVVTPYWSLLGNTILGMDSDERIYVHERQADCEFNLAPLRLDRATVTRALELVKECPAELLQQGRERGASLRGVWSGDVTHTVASAGFWDLGGVVPEPSADPVPDVETIGWGIYIDPVTGEETKVTEQRIDHKTGMVTLVPLDPTRGGSTGDVGN